MPRPRHFTTGIPRELRAELGLRDSYGDKARNQNGPTSRKDERKEERQERRRPNQFKDARKHSRYQADSEDDEDADDDADSGDETITTQEVAEHPAMTSITGVYKIVAMGVVSVSTLVTAKANEYVISVRREGPLGLQLVRFVLLLVELFRSRCISNFCCLSCVGAPD